MGMSGSSGAKVQSVAITIPASSNVGTATISAVNPAKTTLGHAGQSGLDIGADKSQASLRLTNSTTVTATRGMNSGTSPLTVECTVREEQ